MSLRDYLQRLNLSGALRTAHAPISRTYEIAAVLKQCEPAPVLFEKVSESPFRVAGNLFCSKANFADYLGIGVSQIIPTLAAAIDHRSRPEIFRNARNHPAPCQEIVEMEPDLDRLPILRHCEQDGGNYISSGVVFTRHPVHGQNADFHRMMQFSKNEMAVRVVHSRHFDTFLHDCRQIDVAVCIGCSPNVLAAAATSVEIGIDELEIANALEPLQVVKAVTVDVLIPADCEFVLEGTVYLNRTHPEGPFVDLTETYDVIRQEPVFVVKAVTHRSDAIWHALLPGALEHKLLMGMPREPTIYKKVNEVVRCLDVNINPGGCSWLHAVVQIEKRHEDDGKKAIQAAFAGHRSGKHIYVVDSDIDIYNSLEVEWAMATRFQGDRDLIILEKAPGSSLDPSSDPGSHATTRVGFDLTKPMETKGKSFDRAPFPKIDLSHFFPSEGKI
jgi:2,5-furandicarboxylate decarboxylase 1